MIVDRDSLRTLDGVKSAGRKVFLRLDINLPLDPMTGRILDDTRITKSLPTIERLCDSALVIASHQSRPMKSDFATMEKHTEMIQKMTGRDIRFLPDVIGPTAIDAISRLRPGEILVLDNLRFCSEENYNADLETLRRTHFVRRLAPLFDMYVNDAFAAAHRSQPSLAGLPQVLDSYAGKLMEGELLALSKLMEDASSPRLLCLGGAKLETKLSLLETMLRNNNVDKVLVCGQAGIVFVCAAGHDIGSANLGIIASGEELLMASRILDTYRDRILIPVDVAVQDNGMRVDCDLNEISGRPIMDIGPQTMSAFTDAVEEANSIFANGPAGFFELKPFRKGTDSLLLAVARSRANVKVLGGGHLASLADEIGMSKNIHVSTGGGVLLAILGGDELPAISLLMREKSKGKKGRVKKGIGP